MEIKVKESDVIDALKECYDPEIPVDIYDLGLIYKIETVGRDVKILMTFTSPFCPTVDYLLEDIKFKVKELSGAENVDITVTFDPPWNQSKISEDAKAKLGL